MPTRQAEPWKRLDLVFLGTSGFAAPVLEAVHRFHRVRAVVTQPDRPAGRGRHLRRSRIGNLADLLGLPVIQPGRIRRRRSWAPLADLRPDCLVVADYGQILPARLLRVPRLGAVNVHASLLPALRGAAPAIWAIARGLPRTGVTTMRMDAGLDTGPILKQQALDIHPTDTGGSLLARLAPLGAELLVATLEGLANGEIRPRPQDDSLATFAPRIRRRDAALDWALEAGPLANHVRAFSPSPIAFTAAAPGAGGPLATGLFRVHGADAGADSASPGDPPGSFRILGGSRRPRLAIACAQGTTLFPRVVQAAGKRKMSIGSFLRGSSFFRGRSGARRPGSVPGAMRPPDGAFLSAAAAAAVVRPRS